MSDIQIKDAAGAEEPIPNPGLQPHKYRPQDVDEAQERRTERQISAMFLIAAALFIAFAFVYFGVDADETFLGWSAQNTGFGFTLGLAMLLIGIGIIQWARKLMGDHEIVEMRHPASSSAEDREAVLADINAGLDESGIGRRPMIVRSLGLALGALGVPAVVMMRDLGPLPHGHTQTVWKKGMRVVVDVTGEPIKPSDMRVGDLVNAEPSVFFQTDDEGNRLFHGTELLQAKSKAAVIVVRMRPEALTPSKGRENWGVDGILAYSKICTHVGCPISLWEQQTHHLLCPCHQSTFDLADNGKVVFGPAHRPLPQLPLAVDSEGYLIATSDFPEIVAPSYPRLAHDQKKLDEDNS